MTSRGAKNFLIVTSSGATGKPDALKFIEEIEAHGATVWAPACDIRNGKLLESTLRECILERGMPPIKGCIQAAMVLHVSTAYTLAEYIGADDSIL